MDILVRHPDALAVLSILPPSPVSGYLSAELAERLWRPDRVEVEIDARVAAAAGVRKGALLVVADVVLLVEQVHVASDEQGRVASLATVTAYDPVSVPRRILPATAQSHDIVSNAAGETAMKHYVSRSIGEDAAAVRRYGALRIAPDQERGGTGTWRARFQLLTDYLELIGMQTGIGYRARWGEDGDDGFPEFDVVAGEHRERELSVRDGTARREEMLSSGVDRLTYAYVGGQGVGTNRVIRERFLGPGEPAGLERREVFVDARDTDSNATLDNRGDARLAETQAPDAVEIVLAERDGWRYGDDFALGDTLRYRNDWGDNRVVRVVSVTSLWRESLVPDRTVMLDREWPDVREVESGGTQFE